MIRSRHQNDCLFSLTQNSIKLYSFTHITSASPSKHCYNWKKKKHVFFSVLELCLTKCNSARLNIQKLIYETHYCSQSASVKPDLSCLFVLSAANNTLNEKIWLSVHLIKNKNFLLAFTIIQIQSLLLFSINQVMWFFKGLNMQQYNFVPVYSSLFYLKMWTWCYRCLGKSCHNVTLLIDRGR